MSTLSCHRALRTHSLHFGHKYNGFSSFKFYQTNVYQRIQIGPVRVFTTKPTRRQYHHTISPTTKSSLPPEEPIKEETQNTEQNDPEIFKESPNSKEQQIIRLPTVWASGITSAATMVGYAMAPGAFELSTFLIASFGAGATFYAASSINRILDITNDSAMDRAKHRWVASEKNSKFIATVLAGCCAVSGVGSLLLLNPVTAGLALSYLGFRTMVCRLMNSPVKNWVKPIVSAIPPMIGWAAATGGMEMGSWVLGALLVLGQIPTCVVLSYLSREGKMVSTPDKIPRVLLNYSRALLPMGLLASKVGITTWWFALDSLIPAGYLTYLALQFKANPNQQRVRKMLSFSIWYLPIVLALMLLHKTYSSSAISNSSDQNQNQDQN